MLGNIHGRCTVALLALALPLAGHGADRVSARQLPARVSDLMMDRSVVRSAPTADANDEVDGGVIAAHGRQHVFVRLTEPSLAENAAAGGDAKAHMKRISAEQAGFINRRAGGGVNVVARMRGAINGVVLELDASEVAGIARDSAVVRISRVKDYKTSLSETVPHIGAAAVQEAGVDGAGVSVAVLDSGIDYLHERLGGSGDPDDFAANDPNVVEAGTFPTAKVIGGADFVGSTWTGAANTPPLLPDGDPLDDGPGNGHGTHVADIIGGVGGVAPAVDLYAVKVCSSISTSCSGVALLQGMEFAVDPNGDNDTSDHVDIVNMSLGANYGTAFDDDLAFAVDNATRIGVLTVAAAGNGSDKPFVAGTPAAAPTALSVAQTEVPSATQPVLEITAPAVIAGSYQAVFQPWSEPLGGAISGPVQYGDGSGGNLDGCVAFAAGSLVGKIVLIDRGVCSFSVKISNAADGGAQAGVIGLIAPGDPFEGGFGGGTPTVPGYMINQVDANKIKANIAAPVVASFDPANDLPLVLHMVGGSSRGPSMRDDLIKPEIGAPGASISAVAGSGTEVEPFGGTSGATPMVSGAAALLLQAYPQRRPAEIKAVLVNTGETEILNSPVLFGGELAPISRIGGGEVRVDRAYGASGAAWTHQVLGEQLSFGFEELTSEHPQLLSRFVRVRNYGDQAINYRVSPKFRFDNDAANGAVKVLAQNSLWVPPGHDRILPVLMLIKPTEVFDWGMNSGSLGASGDSLTGNEYDGYLQLADTANPSNDIHLPWHVLPRKAGNVVLKDSTVVPNGTTRVTNKGPGTTLVESYSLLGSNGNLPAGGAGENNPVPDLAHVGYATFPVDAGFCSANPSFVMAFAINTHERQTHANAPASFEVDIDTDQDGLFDYAVFSFDGSLSGDLGDGRSLAFSQNLTTGEADAFFFTDHDTHSGNTVLLICGEQIGMDAANFFDPMDVVFLAVDWYYTGTVTDVIDGITISPLGERYLGVFDAGGAGATSLAPRAKDNLAVIDFGATTNNTEEGLLLLYRGGGPKRGEADALKVVPKGRHRH